MTGVVERDAFRLPYTVDGDGRGPHLVFAHGVRVHDPGSLECALRTVPRWVMADVPSGFAGLPSPVIVAGWDGDPIHPLQTAKDVAAAAGVDLIEADAGAIQADPAAIGRLLSGALAKLV